MFPAIKLIHAIQNFGFPYAYLILGGPGWNSNIQSFYLGGNLSTYIPQAHRVRLMDIGNFIALANSRKL